ncbi:MAG TPA: HEAT repeat domain-containing protein [Thermoanaerobaculia bacterium]|nr:HEAT repeat domain-containing protein [Thermoanaerobaculia bacterium]
MTAMRRLLALLLLAGCTAAPAPKITAPPPEPARTGPPYGMSVDEEARVLMLEDRREYDAALVDTWLHHENPLHRQRAAMMLARIGPANAHAPIVAALAPLTADADPNVRATAAFALGQIADLASAPALLTFVADKDGDVAGEAVEALSKLAPKLPFATYAEALKDARPGVHARAVRFLFRFRSDEASEAAARELESPSTEIRREAAYALGRRAYAPARAKLELLLTDPDTLTRSYVVRALGGIASPESLPGLMNALVDSQPWVRTNAAVAIGRIAAKDAKSVESTDAAAIVNLTDDPDPGVRAMATETLGWYAVKNEEARKRLLEIAASGSRWDREIAAGAIAKHLNDESLLPADLSDWAKVRVLESGGAVAESARIKWANDPSTLARIYTISTIPDDKADAQIDRIRAALDDPDPVVRGYALDRFSKTKAPDRLAVFVAAEERARKDKQNDARVTAVRNLDEEHLRPLLGDSDPVIRRVAADAIVELGKPRPHYTPLPVERPVAEYAEIVQWSKDPHTATIHMTRGNIILALLTQEAPLTAWNFTKLARAGYFNDTTFMRVVPNFVLQGGDPRNDMEGSPGYAIRDEINLQKYTRGAVGMALSGPDTGGSQFFITHSPQPHLDGGYTIFGRVTAGMSGVADQTERGDRVITIAIDEAQ